MKNKSNSNMSRREFMQAGSKIAGAVSVGGIAQTAFANDIKRSKVPERVLEKSEVSLGFMPLTDCAALVVAKEKGFFEKHGIDAKLNKQKSWSNIRDKVLIGALDGAHMLASMPIATTLGLGTAKKPMLTAFSMALNGNAITVSHELYARMLEADPQAMSETPLTARALKKVIEEDKQQGRPLMTFATVFPTSTHNYDLRYWMAAAGIHPDKDIRLTVIPPACMVANLEARAISGYCVGEPWNELAVKSGVGRSLITKYEIWNNSPEKVFGVNAEWAEEYPNLHNAVIKALIEASSWIEESGNHEEVVSLLAREDYVDASEDVIEMSIAGTYQYARHLDKKSIPDFTVFNRYSANYPWVSHAEWFISQMYRWGQLQEAVDISEVAEQVYRPELYAQAASELAISYPQIMRKEEGVHASNWQLEQNQITLEMGSDRFFDGAEFNPEHIVDYIYSFDINKNAVSQSTLAAKNIV